MDEIDQEIIDILKQDGRASYVDIAKKTRLSEGAVRKRISALLQTGDIKKFTIELGFKTGARAITLLSINPAYPTSKISQKLHKPLLSKGCGVVICRQMALDLGQAGR